MDSSDLSNLIALHGKTIYGFCRRLTNNRSETDDLYQETFLKAMEMCNKIDKNGNPKGFLISIAVGIWKNSRRKYVRRKRIAPAEELHEELGSLYIPEDQSNPENAVLSKELAITVQNAVNSLTDKLKLPLYMYYTAEMSNEEIASALKIPSGTVKSRLYKGRKKLKEILELEVGTDGKI